MILRRYRPHGLDLGAVRERVAPLLAAKDDVESMREFERLVARVSSD